MTRNSSVRSTIDSISQRVWRCSVVQNTAEWQSGTAASSKQQAMQQAAIHQPQAALA
ncbi:hypothetical protein KDC22_26915 [Paenibacillus tritici]|nr:hypothetical protein KDC22_26915 [Paenibacillus tritici]